jgi:hypothetical protein
MRLQGILHGDGKDGKWDATVINSLMADQLSVREMTVSNHGGSIICSLYWAEFFTNILSQDAFCHKHKGSGELKHPLPFSQLYLILAFMHEVHTYIYNK